MSAKCLNCQTTLQGSYCHHCGQKSSTHRITFSKFVQHDLIHGIFHLDKGVLYTLKSLIYSPGYAARTFIQGKRVMHYNIFALFIIIIALKTLVDLQIAPGEVFKSSNAPAQQSDEMINTAIRHYYKFFYLLIIPLLSAFSFTLLRKLRFNFVEHLVLNAFILAGGFFYALVFSLVEYLANIPELRIYGLLFIGFYILVAYYQATRGTYGFIAYFWRSLLALILFVASLLVIFLAIIVVFYGGNFNGMITLS
ncbi:MAG TPA: DUF3667 domain-containing protein [Bacteroidia bacterium]|nr:DUF3667 domain-containing protein [Bacteroidia bacterium]